MPAEQRGAGRQKQTKAGMPNDPESIAYGLELRRPKSLHPGSPVMLANVTERQKPGDESVVTLFRGIRPCREVNC